MLKPLPSEPDHGAISLTIFLWAIGRIRSNKEKSVMQCAHLKLSMSKDNEYY